VDVSDDQHFTSEAVSFHYFRTAFFGLSGLRLQTLAKVGPLNQPLAADLLGGKR
jgi:hypothetical protein